MAPPKFPESPAPSAEGSGAKTTPSSYQSGASVVPLSARVRSIELLDCAPWPERLLVAALVKSQVARARFRTIGVSPLILEHEPEALIIVAHALTERAESPSRVVAALEHRRPGRRTWGETIRTCVSWPDDWHIRDVERCVLALAKHWLPSSLRWALDGIEAGNWSRLNVVFALADLIRAVETREVA